jgi:hypothetical protein
MPTCTGSGAPAAPGVPGPASASSSPIRPRRCAGSPPLLASKAKSPPRQLGACGTIDPRAAVAGAAAVEVAGSPREDDGNQRHQMELCSLCRIGRQDRRQARGPARDLDPIGGGDLLPCMQPRSCGGHGDGIRSRRQLPGGPRSNPAHGADRVRDQPPPRCAQPDDRADLPHLDRGGRGDSRGVDRAAGKHPRAPLPGSRLRGAEGCGDRACRSSGRTLPAAAEADGVHQY